MKTKKNYKVKRIVAIYLAVVFVLSAVAVYGVSAKTVTKEHLVELMYVDDTYDDYEVTGLGATGRISDAFANYPSIQSGYTSSYNKARALNTDTGRYYTEHYFRLYANGGVVMVTHGTNLPKGDYAIYYYHEGEGQCRAYSTLSATY